MIFFFLLTDLDEICCYITVFLSHYDFSEIFMFSKVWPKEEEIKLWEWSELYPVHKKGHVPF